MATSVEKLRRIVFWCDYQSEGLNDQFRSVSDMEKAYDYCCNHDIIEFLDTDGLRACDTEEEEQQIKRGVTELLGYSIFN